MARVKLENITKIYPGDVKAVDNANIDINDQEFVVLVGPSGCGKSTTLRMIAGLEEISGGSLTIDGKVVNDVPPKDRDIAMVFQNYALYPHMSVYDNMAFGLKIRKFPKDEIDKLVKEAAGILGIENLLDRKPKALSGGQRQRVAVGRAIVRKPKVFLFDEPLSNLDAKLRVQMRAEISSLHNKLKATMVYVTHDQIEAMTMADKIVVMKDGLIQQIGSPLTLYNEPDNLFVAGFIGSPPMNFMPVTIKKEGSKLFADEGEFKIEVTDYENKKLDAYEGKSVMMGVRPENLQVNPKGSKKDSITASVQVIEQLGDEIQLHLATDMSSIIAKVAPTMSFSVEQEVYFTPDEGKLYFFDKETEQVIK
ncbi:MAG: sn-glycerol-3-phosphate ABC transporter ATP-binding protein UgpC [Spirochaetales bacterium]|uniref:Sn-glycerol-3-phosphate ABC transporter ATP-binding protein UgpC n=1 Tax=Candidatus Thalassospirochaeta sargassi TaxID=3119039 RepID=A0AAJ1ICS4_9SPIO|nr:sn-glycerol-3-phosphate ABC transporter ATP-binding protein UgpC [Spirochaetales bacterium]